MRIAALAVLVLAFAVPGVDAQDEETANRVYTSYYQIGWGDLMEWIEIYQQDWEPLLAQAVEEGSITGYNALLHNTGGIYNFRLAMRGTQDTNFDRGAEQLLGRWMEQKPASFERMLSLIQGHDDEIWNIDEINTTPGAGWQYMYDNMVQVAYADWMGFTQAWNDAAGDVLEQARADGVIAGWVVESHNTGGRFNWKVLFLIPEWGDIHELQNRLLTAVPLDHPIWDQWQAHKDEVWEQLPPTGN